MSQSKPTDIHSLVLDLQSLSTQAVSLEPQDIQRAIALSDGVEGEANQWQTYLNAIALFGFEQWLRERSIELPIHYENCSLFHFNSMDEIKVVCGVKVGDFGLCLVAVEDLLDSVIQISQAVFDRPKYAAHFYVVVEVLEEQGQTQIWGFLRADQWRQYQQSHPLQAESYPTYEVPLAWFDPNPEHLLLHLRCLDVDTLALPDESIALEQNNPAAQPAPAAQTQPPNALPSLAQSAMNVGRWLHNELDEVAESLSWMLLPPLAFRSSELKLPSSARSPAEEMDTILAQINQTGMGIPAGAYRAYRDLTQELSGVGIPLGLYVVVWSSPAASTPTTTPPEWTLLVILATEPNQPLPPEIQLQISDVSGVLVEQLPNSDAADSYLYACVAGTWDEDFVVSIATSSTLLTLPPFIFQPDESL
jgi:hypothetical protein